MNSSGRLALWLLPLICFAPCGAQQLAPVSYAPPATEAVAAPAEAPSPAVSAPSATNAQPQVQHSSYWPHPYTFGGLALNSGGYAPTAGTFGGGAETDTRHLVALAEAWYEDAPKQDSGTGNEFGVKARGFWRIDNGWYFGGGAQWSKLDTIVYTKQAWRPDFGGGKDIKHENFSMRAQVLYVLPGTDTLNALQGPEISLWMPSPASKTHFFYRQTLGLYEFHQTAVPGNPGTSDRQMASFLDFTFMYRF